VGVCSGWLTPGRGGAFLSVVYTGGALSEGKLIFIVVQNFSEIR